MFKLTIITINLNNAEGLLRTLNSIKEQKFKKYQHIIIDGGSQDKSIEYIQEYENHFSGDSLIWRSEPDNGIYEAMNKGIKLSSGNYIYFLNSGDHFINSNSLVDFENENTTEDFVYYNIQTDRRILTYPDHLTFLFFFRWTICHQAIFIKKKIFDEGGYFSSNYRITADWVHLTENICFRKTSYKHINRIISFYEENGISSSPHHQDQIETERENFINSKLPNSITEDFNNYIDSLNELQFYKSSKLIQWMASIQKSNIYKRLRGVK